MKRDNFEDQSFMSVPCVDLTRALSILESVSIPVSTFRNAQADVFINLPSSLNFKEIQFNHDEQHLAWCFLIFKFYHNNPDNFSVRSCSMKTKISEHHVKKIYNKYIKNDNS